MTRKWRRSLARQQVRQEEDRAQLERRIAAAINEDAHAAGLHALERRPGCPSCERPVKRLTLFA